MASIVEQPDRHGVQPTGARSRYRLVAAALLLVLVGAVAPASAAAAPTETVTCGEVITHSIVMANDVGCPFPPPSPVLIIGADNITLDLGGHSVYSGYGTAVYSSGHSGVTIESGSVGATEGMGIVLSGDHNDTVRDIVGEAEFNSLSLTGGSQNTVQDSQFDAGYGGPDVLLSGEHGDVIRGNTVIHAGVPDSVAIRVDNADGNQLIDNAMQGTLLIDGNNNEVSFNRVAHAADDGIDVAGVGNVLLGNVAYANGAQYPPPSDGIKVHTPGNELVANIADNNGNYGIEAVPGVTDGGGNQANANGNPAQCLNIACSGIPPVPATPTGLTASPGNGSVTVSWQPNPAADAILHYNVFRTDQNFSGAWATPLGTTFANASNVVNGRQYCYQVSATNSTGESARSTPVCATPTGPPNPLPATPTGLTASPGNGSVTLSWQPNPVADAVLHYSVYRTDQTFGGAWATVTGTTFTNASAVLNGTSYCYQITATSATGESARSAPVCATPTGPPTPVPSTPSGLVATPGNGSVALSWQPNPAADAVTYYSVYRTDQWFSGSWATLAGTASTDGLDVVNGTRYCYQITASNGSGESAKTAPVCATPTAPTAPPTPPAPRTPPPVPPAPRITAHPAGTSTQTTATFTFTDSQKGVRFECRLDGGAFSNCSSPRRYTGLRIGQHTFRVEALNSLGRAGGDTTYKWTVKGTVNGILKGAVRGKYVITSGNVHEWAWSAVVDQFYGARSATKLTAFRVTHCAKQRSGRFRCDVSWRKSQYAFSGTVTTGSVNPRTGQFKFGFSLLRRDTHTGARKRVNLPYS